MIIALLMISLAQSMGNPVWLEQKLSPKGDASVFVHQGTKVVTRKGASFGNWVSAWNAFATLTYDGTVTALSPHGEISVKGKPGYFYDPSAWTVNPSGRKIAGYNLQRLSIQIVSISDGKVLKELRSPIKLANANAYDRTLDADRGIAWSPDESQLVFSVPDPPDTGSDGFFGTTAIFYNLSTGKWHQQKGFVPLAFLNNGQIYGLRESAPNLDGWDLILETVSGKVQRRLIGNVASANLAQGSVVVVRMGKDDKDYVEVWSKSLTKRISRNQVKFVGNRPQYITAH